MARSDTDASTRVLFLYLGRRGAMPRFTLEVVRAARTLPDMEATSFISAQNELGAAFEAFGRDVVSVDTFERPTDLLAGWRLLRARRTLEREIRDRRVELVIEMMPHVWSPWLGSAIRRAGARYVTIAHDAEAHPGDPTGLANRLTALAFRRADRVVTLSRTVADRLLAAGRVRPERLSILFHPDLTYDARPIEEARSPDRALRLLFLGRILPYKGLALLVEAVALARAAGACVTLGVFGEGDLGSAAARLDRLGAEVINRWLTEDEIAGVLARHDVMVVSHVEASQSGVVAAAFGAGLPVIATPVGGLPEQVRDGVTGLIAAAPTASALATAIGRLAREPALYDALCRGVSAQREARSMDRFVRDLIAAAHRDQPRQEPG